MNKIDLYKKDAPILIDNTGVLEKYGFKNIPIVINYSTLNKILIKHGIPREDLILIKEQIENNLLIASSFTRDDSIIFYIGQWDSENRPIMVALNLEKWVNNMPVYKITSIYGRNNTRPFIKRLFDEDKIIYYDKNAYLWFKILGYDIPEFSDKICDEFQYHGKYLISFCIIKN